MLSDADLARARELQNRTFDLTATVTRLVTIDDGAGGTLPGVPVTFTSPCRLSPHKAADREAVVAGAVQGVNLWDVTFPALTTVGYADRITIGTQEFEVISRYAPKSRETARVVLCVMRSGF